MNEMTIKLDSGSVYTLKESSLSRLVKVIYAFHESGIILNTRGASIGTFTNNDGVLVINLDSIKITFRP